MAKLAPKLQARLAHLLESSAAFSATPPTRIISATKHDLISEVEKGSFGNDLFYRLNVVDIRVPPLRERREDILPLVRALLDSYSANLGRRVPTLSQDAEAVLLQHTWPGNLRELENLVEHALLIWPAEVLEPEAFAPIHTAHVFRRPRVGNNVTLHALEKEHILSITARVRDRKDVAAILGISGTTLWRKRRAVRAGGRREGTVRLRGLTAVRLQDAIGRQKELCNPQRSVSSLLRTHGYAEESDAMESRNLSC